MTRKLFFFALFSLLGQTPLLAADDVPLGQLPRDVRPLAYRVEFTVLPAQERFSGHVEIDLDLGGAKQGFFLHGRDLEVTQVALDAGGRSVTARYTQVGDGGVARVDLDGTAAGKATLKFDYTAAFNDSLEGLYRVRAGNEWYAFTQFEDISARGAFPSFDEPYFKVPFDISLVVSADDEVVSNTPVAKITPMPDGLKRVRFEHTRPLPTYLVAVAVGPFDVVDGPTLPPTGVRDRPIPLRGIAVRGKGAQLAYALGNTRPVVEALETYFGIPYPYAKLDLIAVPDFAAGAMENAAAITYREPLLLIADTAGPRTRRRFLSVHAHELAHQWFGDLVSPAWWNDIWLNESFATWMAATALDLWQPDGGFRRDLEQRKADVMAGDSLLSARRIRQPVLDNHDIADAFDGITYAKGGSVLSMYESLLGREAFRNGVRDYLRQHAWGVATAEDFVNALAARSKRFPPRQVFESFFSFLDQPGLPFLQLRQRCDNGKVGVRLQQSRYLPLGSAGSPEQQWILPVCLGAPQQSAECLLLKERESDFEPAWADCPAYIVPDAGGKGYYRWSLDEAGWRALIGTIDQLSTDEKMSLAASLQGAFDAGTISVSAWLDIAGRLAAQPDWHVATAPMEALVFLYERVADPTQQEALRARFTRLYGARLDQVGVNEPPDIDSARMQSGVVGFLANRAGLEELRDELRSIAWRYAGWSPGRGESMPGRLQADGVNDNILGEALRVAVEEDSRTGTGDPTGQFSEYLLGLALASDDPLFRSRAFSALARSNDPGFRRRLLDLALTERVRDNEIYYLLEPQFDNPAAREAAWQWLQERLRQVIERVPTWRQGRLATVGAYFCDPDHRAAVADYFGPLVPDLLGGPRSLAQALEQIDLCIARAAFHRQGLAAALRGPVRAGSE